jgi:Fe-S cluster assembly scaffold protein SufB
MNNFIKQVIEEKFASKAQQRFFYAKANEKGKPNKEKKKWSKWAKEFSDKTDYDKIPDKVEKEEEVDEIVDAAGNFATSKKPSNFNSKGITSDSTSDEVALTAAGQSSISPKLGMGYRRYWGESDMSKVLGADKLLHSDDVDYEEAKDTYDELGIEDPEEQDKRAKQLGFDPSLPDGKQRIVENPKKFMEEYIDNLLKQKGKDNDVLSKEEEVEEVEINPIVAKQIKSLKNSMKTYGLKPDHILKGLKDDNE